MASLNTQTRYVELYVDSRDSDQALTPYVSYALPTAGNALYGNAGASQVLVNSGVTSTAAATIPALTLVKTTNNAGLLGSTDYPVFNFQKMFGETVGFKVVDAQIPFSYYTVSSVLSNNTLAIKWNNVAYTLTIPDGNYTADEFVTMFNFAVAENTTLTAANIILSWGTTGNQQGKFTLKYIGTNAADYVDFAASSGIAKVMGFAPVQRVVGNNTMYLLGDYCANLGGEDYIYLRSNIGAMLSEAVYSTTSTVATSNVIAKIPVNVNRNEIIQWSNPSKEFFSIFPILLKRMTFWFTTKDSTDPIQFNGQPFALKLGLVNVLRNTTSMVQSGQSNYVTSRAYYT